MNSYRYKMRYDLSKLKKFETDAECSERNQKIIQALEKEPKLSKVVGQCIKGCAPFSRCQHILCSHCKREFRLQYVPKICEFLARQKSESCIYAVTLLEPLDASSTKVLDITKLKNTLYRRLKRLFGNEVIAIGGFDISLNTDAENSWKPFFHPHWHLIFITKLDAQYVRERLKHYYHQTDIIKRPVRMVKVNSYKRAVSYMFSPYFSKRVRFLNTKRKGRNPFYDGKEYKLNGSEICKLAKKLIPSKTFKSWFMTPKQCTLVEEFLEDLIEKDDEGYALCSLGHGVRKRAIVLERKKLKKLLSK